MADTHYDSTFFAQHVAGSLASARAVLPVLLRYHKPRSIVDIGCGLGAWLKAALELGVTDVLGIDGDYVGRDSLLIPEDRFCATDLQRRITVDRRFDLAISTEVAEHLPYHRSETFVSDLTALSDVVLFSAALPYQGGTDHINEQWLEFWALLFQRHGYVPIDLLRRQFWCEATVEFWYSQNLIVFCTEGAANMFPCEFLAPGRPLSYPHPLTFLVNVARYRPLSASAVAMECEDYKNMLRAYQSGDGTLPLLQMADATDEGGSPLFPKSRTLVVDAHAESAARDAEVMRLAGELEAAQTRATYLSAELTAKKLESGRLVGELESAQTQAIYLSAELTARNLEVGRLVGELESAQTQATYLSAELAARNLEVGRLMGELESARSQATHLTAQVTTRDVEIERLQHDLVGRTVEREHLAATLELATALAAAKEQEVSALRNSLTWRLTQPLRQWIGWLSGRKELRKSL